MWFIRETWRMHFMGSISVETHSERDCPANKVKNLKKVKKWIKDWIETWKDNAEDNNYKFIDFKTDYKTFAKCRIKANGQTDTFSLKVVKG